MRLRSSLILVVIAAIALAPAVALAQTGDKGNIEGDVFLDSGVGGGGLVFVRAYRASTGAFVKGVCVDGYQFNLFNLDPGRYKIRFGFGCGTQADRAPYEWFDLEGGTDAINCAAVVVVSAGYATVGVNATVSRTQGPRNPCGAAEPRSTPTVGVLRPIQGATGIAASGTPTSEVDFTPGVSPTPAPATPVATIVGVSGGALIALMLFGYWLYRRVAP